MALARSVREAESARASPAETTEDASRVTQSAGTHPDGAEAQETSTDRQGRHMTGAEGRTARGRRGRSGLDKSSRVGLELKATLGPTAPSSRDRMLTPEGDSCRPGGGRAHAPPRVPGAPAQSRCPGGRGKGDRPAGSPGLRHADPVPSSPQAPLDFLNEAMFKIR